MNQMPIIFAGSTIENTINGVIKSLERYGYKVTEIDTIGFKDIRTGKIEHEEQILNFTIYVTEDQLAHPNRRWKPSLKISK